MKYFKETEKERKIHLRKEDGKLYQILGDVEVEESLLSVLQSFFRRFGGRYSVLTEEETILGLLDLQRTYGLTAEAVSEIGLFYIKDLFDKYSLKESLQDYIEKYGRRDAAFVSYLDYVDEVGKIDQEEYKLLAKDLEDLRGEYGDAFVDYLQGSVLRKHISPEELRRVLPEKELIKKDEEQLRDLARFYRIHFSFVAPISYRMVESAVKDKTLSSMPEEFSYYISTKDLKVPSTFTKQDFLESIKKHQEYTR